MATKTQRQRDEAHDLRLQETSYKALGFLDRAFDEKIPMDDKGNRELLRSASLTLAAWGKEVQGKRAMRAINFAMAGVFVQSLGKSLPEAMLITMPDDPATRAVQPELIEG